MQPMSPQNRRNFEKSLIAGIVSGNKEAMNEIYKTYAPALNGFVRLFLSDPNDVSDIIHDTMLEVWRKAERFEGRSSLKTWVFSIAKNKSIDRNRKYARIDYTDDNTDIEDDALNAADVLAVSQEAKTVRDAIAQLKPDHRRAIHLSFFEDLTYKEIAEIEDCPEGTIKTRILYAKRSLQHILQDLKK